MSATIQLIGGKFQDSEGNPLSGGYLQFELSQDAQVNGNTEICAGYLVKVTLDGNGSVDTTATQKIWGNDALSPANTFYNVKAFTESGQLVWGPNAQQVTGAGTFDVGTWVPGSVNTTGPNIQTIQLLTNGAANSSQNRQNLVAGSGVTLTDSGSGNIVLDSAGAGGASNPAVATLNTTGNKCLGVSPYLAVAGDWTTAIQTAINDLNTEGGGTLWIPAHQTYNVNGPLQDTGGANAVIVLPPAPLVVGTTKPIRIKGLGNPNVYGGLGAAVLQTTVNTASANFIGGYVASGPYGGFINTDFMLEDIQIKTTATNPAMAMVNAKFFATSQINNVTISSAAPGIPSATTSVGYVSPVLSNNVSVSIDHLTVVGFYKLAQISEHAHIGHIEGANSHLGYVFDTEPGTDPTHSTWGNTVSIDYLWCQICDYAISAGVSQTTVNIQAADFEVTTTAAVNDPSNLLFGIVNYNVPYNDARSTSTIDRAIVVGAANLQMKNLKYPGVAYGLGSSSAALTIRDVNPNTFGTYLELKNSTSAADWAMQVFGSSFTGIGHTGFGFFDAATGKIPFSLNDTALTVSGTVGIGFASGDSGTTSKDTAISRLSAGAVAIGNGTVGDFSGTLKATLFQGPATAPSGATSLVGWCFSQDGHISYANGTTWVLKV